MIAYGQEIFMHDYIDNDAIQRILPHRYPFLMIDRILDLESRTSVVAIKNVTINEPFFQGHFPSSPVMPGVLILECLAQAGGALLLKDPDYAARLAFFASMNNVVFHDQVTPGDQLRLEMTVENLQSNTVKMSGVALVEGKVVCEGQFTFSLAHEPTKAQIHPTASVHRTAVLGKNVVVGPNTIVGENVTIGDNTKLEGHCFLEKWTQIGDDCHIHYGCVIGSGPQDLGYKGEKSWVVIGDRNNIREYVTINRASGAGEVTLVGNDNTLLTNVHLAHNCKLGSNIVIANMTNVAGHTTIEDKAVIGGMTGIHQFVRIGYGAMVGAYTRLPQDVPPFMLCEGNPAIVRGLNLIGMRRGGVSKAGIAEVKEIYKTIYRSEMNTTQALAALKESSFETEQGKHMLDFVSVDSKRGFTKKGDSQSDTAA
jgi:UDP-N-acetylglucosamine acyltransferase